MCVEVVETTVNRNVMGMLCKFYCFRLATGIRLLFQRERNCDLTESSAEDAHYGVLVDDPHVTHQRQLQTAGHSVTLHCSDDRLAEQHPGRTLQAITGKTSFTFKIFGCH